MPGGDVGDRGAGLDRLAAGALAGDAHQPAHALGDEVEAAKLRIGSGAAEAGERAIDQPGVALAQIVIAEAELGHRVVAVILDQHVGIGEQAAQHRLAGFCA